MREYIDEKTFLGKKVGKITIVEYLGKIKKEKGDNHRFWLGKCECGKNIYLRQTDILKETRKSCPKCNRSSYKHGMTNTRLFHIWQNMRGRCYCKTNYDYKDYGNRGIKICDEWEYEFLNFYNWAINNGYSDELTLDRIDNEKDYCPENCRWSTAKFQSNHKTNNVYYTFKRKTQTSKQWCDEYGISQTTFIDRLKRGWTLEQALTIPTKGTHRKVK